MREVLAVVLLWTVSASASAQTTAGARPEPEPESGELHAMRSFEDELFRGAGVASSASDTLVRVSDTAAVASSTAPTAAPTSTTAQPSRDLSWLEGLALPDIPVRWDERVIRYLEFFRDDPRGNRFIRAWMRRVDRYGPMIREQLSRQNLPDALIYVAMVESGFNPTARSHAGAAGMWQFVRRTGEEFGLNVSHWEDQRLDPVASTAAAGRYLGQLHERFGTWELAFAAYNMGYGALLRAIRKYNTNDYWALSHFEAGLPFETTVYVSKILACAIVAQNPERFGLADLEREPPLRWESVRIGGGTPLRAIARAAGVTVADLRTLNPSLRRNRTPPGGTSTIHLPPEAVERFSRRWARNHRRGTYREHVLRFGERLASIARAAGVRERELRELNGIGDAEAVPVGTRLLVPMSHTAPETPTEAVVVSVPEPSAGVDGRRRVFYRIVRGDSTAEIARFFEVEESELARWNQLDPGARLQPGMFLQLFVREALDLSRALVLTPDEVTVLVVGSEAFFAYHERQNGRLRFRYTVQSGDTLSEIGRRFGIRTASLARINQIARDSVLRVGDELIVYAEAARLPPQLRERLEATPAAPEGNAPADGASDRDAADVPAEDESSQTTEAPPEDTAHAAAEAQAPPARDEAGSAQAVDGEPGDEDERADAGSSRTVTAF